MKLQRWLISLGMIGVISFLIHAILGRVLWPGYNPVTQYVSELTADNSPSAPISRVFVIIYEICFLAFSLGMVITAFRKHNLRLKIGYTSIFVIAIFSILGYGVFPMTVGFLFSLKNIMHLIITTAMFCSTILAVYLLSWGYFKQKLKKLGQITLIAALLCTTFNLWLLYVLLNGQNIQGLIERLAIYTFHAFTFIVSLFYTSKRLAKLSTERGIYRKK